VPEKRVLTDGTHTDRAYHVPNNHNEGMLIAYLAEGKDPGRSGPFTPPAVGTPPPGPPSPYTLSLVENLDRLKLNYEKILPLHGRLTNKEELMKAAGK